METTARRFLKFLVWVVSYIWFLLSGNLTGVLNVVTLVLGFACAATAAFMHLRDREKMAAFYYETGYRHGRAGRVPDPHPNGHGHSHRGGGVTG